MITTLLATSDLTIPLTVLAAATLFSVVGLIAACWAGRGAYHDSAHRPHSKDSHHGG